MSIPVCSIDENGKRTEYPSMVDAAKALGASPSQISMAVNFGKRCHGMMWERDWKDG